MCNRWSIRNDEPGPSVLFETSFIKSGTYSRLKQERGVLSAGHRHRNSSQADLREATDKADLPHKMIEHHLPIPHQLLCLCP